MCVSMPAEGDLSSVPSPGMNAAASNASAESGNRITMRFCSGRLARLSSRLALIRQKISDVALNSPKLIPASEIISPNAA